MSKLRIYDLEAIAKLLRVELEGNPKTEINSIETLERAGPGALSFYNNPRYYKDLLATQASAVILSAEHAPGFHGNKLLAEDPYYCYARASHLFSRSKKIEPGIAGSAEVHPSVTLGSEVSIGANAVIGEDAIIGDRVIIGANCVIGEGVVIGEDSRLQANVTLAHHVSIGRRVHLYSGVVIGSDGFGFAKNGDSYFKIAQLGSVIIGDDVEVGANSCIDRGALDDTIIGNGVKIDNQVQIAHNVRVGDNTVICGCSAVAGSSKIGRNCVIAGGVGIINHIEICDGVTVTAMSLVNQSISEPGSYSSGTGLSKTAEWKKNIVRLRNLAELFRDRKK